MNIIILKVFPWVWAGLRLVAYRCAVRNHAGSPSLDSKRSAVRFHPEQNRFWLTGVLCAGGQKPSGGACPLITRVPPWDCLRRWAYVGNAGGHKPSGVRC